MKKWIVIFAVLVMMLNANKIFADKATSYTDTSNEKIILIFNASKRVGGEVYYIPIFAQMTGQAITVDGGKLRITVTDEIGEVTDTKKTKSEIKALLEKDELQSLYAEFYSEALDEEIN